MSVLNFIQYHNAVPIALGIVVLGAGGAYAATNPESIYSATQTVVSVDNTYLVDKDLSTFTPTVRVTAVTEDEKQYYVNYEFTTIDLVDSVWRDTTRSEQMNVSKEFLGQYKDLGVYVTQEFGQKIDNEIAYLKEIQDIARKNISLKSVATAYSGLIGALLSESTDVIAGYTPVVVPPAPVVAVENVQTQEQTQETYSTVPQQPTQEVNPLAPTIGNDSGDREAPTVQVLGANPARVALKSTYLDLGALVTDNVSNELGVTTYVNGNRVDQVQIDTYSVGEWTIRYESVDQAGNIGRAERVIVVYDPYEIAEETGSEPDTVPEQATGEVGGDSAASGISE